MGVAVSVDGFVLVHGVQEVEITSQKKNPIQIPYKKNFLETKS